MIIHEMPQRSPEWFALRLGKITGTSFPTMANGTAKGIKTLCGKIATERDEGVSCESGYANDAMQYGIDTEPVARGAYETSVFQNVQEVGFIELDDLVGFSPDGLVGEDGGVEIKCPRMAEIQHRRWRDRGKAWTEYRWQVQGALWITGRKWWDFVSYRPDFGPKTQLLIERVGPDPEAFKKLETGAAKCREAIAKMVKDYHANVPG